MAPVEHVKVGVENGEVSRVERRWRCPEVWNLDGDQGRCCNGAGLSGVGRAGGGKAGRQVASRLVPSKPADADVQCSWMLAVMFLFYQL